MSEYLIRLAQTLVQGNHGSFFPRERPGFFLVGFLLPIPEQLCVTFYINCNRLCKSVLSQNLTL